jgi:hypothetical protein
MENQAQNLMPNAPASEIVNKKNIRQQTPAQSVTLAEVMGANLEATKQGKGAVTPRLTIPRAVFTPTQTPRLITPRNFTPFNNAIANSPHLQLGVAGVVEAPPISEPAKSSSEDVTSLQTPSPIIFRENGKEVTQRIRGTGIVGKQGRSAEKPPAHKLSSLRAYSKRTAVPVTYKLGSKTLKDEQKPVMHKNTEQIEGLKSEVASLRAELQVRGVTVRVPMCAYYHFVG